MLYDLSLNAWRQEFHEARQLFLALQCTLICDDVVSDFVLQISWQLKVLYRGVDLCKLRLELSGFCIELRYKHSKLSENIGVDNGSKE